MRPFLAIAALLLLGAAPPSAGGVGVAVRAPSGKPIANAVVSIRLIGRATPAPRMGSGYAVKQQHIQFNPFVLVVPVGADVVFPNLDPVRHHVYSFSPAKRFELKLYAREQSRMVRFDRAGPVSLGCNIHDQMSGFVYVTDTAYTARTDEKGNATLADVPAGPVTISVWHPYLRAPANQVSRQSKLAGAARETFIVTVRPPPAAASSY